MKQIATLVAMVGLIAFHCAYAQPVNTHRSFTWDGWPANSLSQTNFKSNFGPDNVNVSLSFSFAGTAYANAATTATYANLSGRTSDLKITKKPSEDTLYSTLTFNKNLEGLNLEINPFKNDYVIVMAYNLAGSRVHVKGAFDILMTDSVARNSDTLINNKDANVHLYFDAPVSKIIFKAIRNSASTKGMEFALGPVSWYNSSDYTPNPDLTYSCEGNEIMLVLDASTSIDATEQSQLINAIESMLDPLQHYGITPNYLSVVEFSQQARLSLDYTQITAASIAPGGAIYDYLHNTNGNGYYSTNTDYGGYTNWSQAFKVATDRAKTRRPNLLIFFTDGAPNKVYEENVVSNSNILYSASWGVNRTALYADTLKQLGTHIIGVGVDKINTTTQDFYFRYPIEMVNPVIYDYLVPPPSNISTADFVTVSAFPYLEQVFRNFFTVCTSILPVDFKAVQITPDGCKKNTVSWNMQNESDAILYEVEKSVDGTHFESIAKIEPTITGKKGNYSVVDENPGAALIYYRVKAVEQSGKIIYSKQVKQVSDCQVNASLAIWPNPVRDGRISLQMSNAQTGRLNLQIFDAQGRRILQRSVIKNQAILQLQEDLQHASRGLYTLAIFDQQQQLIARQQFLIQ